MSDPVAATGAPPPRSRRSGLMAQFGGRIGRDTLTYALATAIVLPFSLVTVAVLTRYLNPSQYGELAVLFVFAGLLTTLYNVGSLQGTLMWVFGGAGEEADAGRSGQAAAGAKRQALGSGLALTALIVSAATIPLLVFAEPLRDVLVGPDVPVAAVRWAAASAALGSFWRLVINVFRMERRPRTFAVLNTLRPTLVLGCSLPLVASGHGVTGAMAGTAIGTAASVAVCLALGRRSYAAACTREDTRQILSLGSKFVVLVVTLWVVHNADVLVLSRFATESDVGLYRLAGRVAAFISYFVSAFLMAWGPLEATSLFQAAYDRHGRAAIRSRLVTYYLITSLSIVLAMAVAADVLIGVAAASYADAAPLIAPIGFGFVAYGGFIVLARSATMERRNLIFAALAAGSAVLFVALGVALVPWLGGYGAALAVVLSMLCGCIAFMVVIARSALPVPFDYARLLGVLALALAAYGAMNWFAPGGGARSAADVAVFTLYCGLLVLLRIVPLAHLRPLTDIATAMLPARGARNRLLDALHRLASTDWIALDLLVREHMTPTDAARRAETEVDALLAGMVRALRDIEGRPASTDADARIGAYLVDDSAPAERDAVARRLWNSGVDPFDLHVLEMTLKRVAGVSARRWRRSAALPALG